MKPDEIRTLSNDEIFNRLDEAYEELLNLRVQHGVGQLANPSRMREVRRDVARMKTILRERELWEAYEALLQEQEMTEEHHVA